MSGEKPAADPPLADREQLRLRPVDRLLDLRRILVADAGDLAGGADEVPQQRLALHDPRVLGRVDGRRRRVRQRAEVGAATDRLEVTCSLQRLRDGHDVDRLAPLREVQHHRVDAAVGLAVEVLGLEEVRDLDHGVAIDEDGAEHGLLGLDGLRRKTVDHGARGLHGRTSCPKVAGGGRSAVGGLPRVREIRAPSGGLVAMRCGRLVQFLWAMWTSGAQARRVPGADERSSERP